MKPSNAHPGVEVIDKETGDPGIITGVISKTSTSATLNVRFAGRTTDWVCKNTALRRRRSGPLPDSFVDWYLRTFGVPKMIRGGVRYKVPDHPTPPRE